MIDITDAIKTREATPERQLWQSVILQAFVDAASGDMKAVRFLTNERKWLQTVCEMAGFNVQCVIQGAKKKIDPRWLRLQRQAYMKNKTS